MFGVIVLFMSAALGIIVGYGSGNSQLLSISLTALVWGFFVLHDIANEPPDEDQE